FPDEPSRGQPAAAIQTYQRVLSKVGRLTNLNATALYNLACLDSLSSALVGKGGTTPSSPNDRSGKDYADRAMSWLKRSVAAGWKNHSHMKQDTDLDPLRGRPDFQELMMDMAFPDHPFAR